MTDYTDQGSSESASETATSSENDDEYGSLDSVGDSDLEYSESESESTSYVYPWPTSSEDSWADISSDEVIQKILLKLPTYDPPQSDEDNSSNNNSPFGSEHSDSFVLRNDDELAILQKKAISYNESQMLNNNSPSESISLYPIAHKSQLAPDYLPYFYLQSVEWYEMYKDFDDDGIIADDEEEANEEAYEEVAKDTKEEEVAKDTKEEEKINDGIHNKGLNQADIPEPAPLPMSPSASISAVKQKALGQKRRAKRRAKRKNKKIKDSNAIAQSSVIPENAKIPKKKTRKFRVGTQVKVVHPKYHCLGIVRFIGHVGVDTKSTANKSKRKIKYGIELLHDDEIGEHNGTYEGKAYFVCKDEKKNGVFLIRDNIRKYHKSKHTTANVARSRHKNRERNNAQMYGNMFNKLWEDRIRITSSGMRFYVPKKPGPRETGKIKYYGGDKEYADELKEDNSKFLDENVPKSRTDYNAAIQPKKEGPRDIGITHGWKGTEYVEVETGPKMKELSAEEREAMRKLGPRAVGTAHGWKGTDYDEDEEEQERIRKKVEIERNRKLLMQEELRKSGPREMEKPKNWNKIKYDENEIERQRIIKREIIEQQKKEEIAELRKLGPREMEKPKNWNKIKYDENEVERQRALKREVIEQQKQAEIAELRKLGPREVVKPKNWKKIQYDEEEEGQLRAKREAQEAEKRKAIAEELRKLGPRAVKKPKNWKKIKYSDEEADRQRANKKAAKLLKKKENIIDEIRKPGPRDIGKNKYKGTKLKKKENKESKKNKEKIKKKLGPRDIGKNKYKGTKLKKKKKNVSNGNKSQPTSPKVENSNIKVKKNKTKVIQK